MREDLSKKLESHRRFLVSSDGEAFEIYCDEITKECLANLDLNSCVIQSSVFKNCQFVNIDLGLSMISKVDFIDCVLENIDLTKTDLYKCNFIRCTIKGLNARYADMIENEFIDCLIENSVFENNFNQYNTMKNSEN